MAKSKRSINSVIHDSLTGNASVEDEIRLQEWLDESPQNREEYEQFLTRADLSGRYRQIADVDEGQAWMKFQKKHFPVRSLRWGRVARYAAVLMLPVLGFWGAFVLSKRMNVKPELTSDMRVAMEKSGQQGKQRAILTLTNGEKVELQPTSAQPLQPSVVESMEQQQPDSLQMVKPMAENNRLVTPQGSEYWMTFEDGTIVHLNYNTTLMYPPHFSPVSRTVYLDGEAYFKVAKDNQRPFRVVTANGVVKEYGTSFNVNTYMPGCTKVVLVEGSVSVSTNEGTEERMIQPGELAVLRSASADIQVNKVDMEPYIAWNSGRFVFDNCSLESLMEVISHWYNKQVVFEAEEIKRMRFTGDVDRYGSITPIMKAIQRVTGLDVEVSDEKIVLRQNTINN